MRKSVFAVCLFGAVVWQSCSGATCGGCQSVEESTAVDVDTESTMAGQPLRVFSLNTWLVPFASELRAERRERLAEAIGTLAPDIVCFQEIWLPSDAEQIAEALQGELPFSVEDGGGLVMLSRYPILDWSFVAFDAIGSSLGEQFANKSVLDVLVLLPSGVVRVVNTHLVFERTRGSTVHGEQLQQLVDTLGPPDDMPTVMCGDLNMRSADGEELNPDFAHLTDDTGMSLSLDHPRPATRIDWPRSDRSGWDPDYVLFRPGDDLPIRVVDATLALDTPEDAVSDHNAIVVDFFVGHLEQP